MGYGTSGKAQKGRIKRINTNFPPPKTPETYDTERGVPPAGLSRNKAITRTPLQPSDDNNSDPRRERCCKFQGCPRYEQETGRLLTRLEITVLPRVPPGGGHVLLLYRTERTFDACYNHTSETGHLILYKQIRTSRRA